MKWAIVVTLAMVAAGSGCCWRPAWCNQQQYAQPTYAQPVYAQQPCQPCVQQVAPQCSCY